MAKVKPLHVGVVVLGAVALGTIAYRMLSTDRVTLLSTVTLVDVVSGQLFEFDVRDRTLLIPEINPTNGQETLFPVEQDDAGEWRISPNQLGGLKRLKQTPAAVVDRQSGAIKTNGQPAQHVSTPGTSAK